MKCFTDEEIPHKNELYLFGAVVSGVLLVMLALGLGWMVEMLPSFSSGGVTGDVDPVVPYFVTEK